MSQAETEILVEDFLRRSKGKQVIDLIGFENWLRSNIRDDVDEVSPAAIERLCNGVARIIESVLKEAKPEKVIRTLRSTPSEEVFSAQVRAFAEEQAANEIARLKEIIAGYQHEAVAP